MTLAAAIRAALLADSAVAALVGTRVYPVSAPQSDESVGIEPTIVYSLNGRDHEYSVDRRISAMLRWHLVCVSRDYDTSHALADAAIAALDRYRGVLGGTGGVAVKVVEILDERDLPDEFEIGVFLVGITAQITT